jgi:hypothetical protein
LNKFEERGGGSNQDVETNVIRGCHQQDKPVLLISLEREIPRLFEGARDVAESGNHHCGVKCQVLINCKMGDKL